MRKISRITALAITIGVALTIFMTGAAFAEAAHVRRIRMAGELIREMTSLSDADALGNVIKSGKGVAIFPAVTKAGLIVGGQVGEGVVFLRKPNGTWTGPAFMGISGASIGLQIGAQSVGLVLVITNDAGLRAFTGGNSFKLGADVAIAAGPIGRDASAATDSRAKAAIYSYSITKGLFAGITLEGSVINQNRDAAKAYWGRDTSAKTALTKQATDKRVASLIQDLKVLIAKAQ